MQHKGDGTKQIKSVLKWGIKGGRGFEFKGIFTRGNKYSYTPGNDPLSRKGT